MPIALFIGWDCPQRPHLVPTFEDKPIVLRGELLVRVPGIQQRQVELSSGGTYFVAEARDDANTLLKRGGKSVDCLPSIRPADERARDAGSGEVPSSRSSTFGSIATGRTTRTSQVIGRRPASVETSSSRYCTEGVTWTTETGPHNPTTL